MKVKLLGTINREDYKVWEECPDFFVCCLTEGETCEGCERFNMMLGTRRAEEDDNARYN